LAASFIASFIFPANKFSDKKTIFWQQVLLQVLFFLQISLTIKRLVFFTVSFITVLFCFKIKPFLEKRTLAQPSMVS